MFTSYNILKYIFNPFFRESWTTNSYSLPQVLKVTLDFSSRLSILINKIYIILYSEAIISVRKRNKIAQPIWDVNSILLLLLFLKKNIFHKAIN